MSGPREEHWGSNSQDWFALTAQQGKFAQCFISSLLWQILTTAINPSFTRTPNKATKKKPIKRSLHATIFPLTSPKYINFNELPKESWIQYILSSCCTILFWISTYSIPSMLQTFFTNRGKVTYFWAEPHQNPKDINSNSLRVSGYSTAPCPGKVQGTSLYLPLGLAHETDRWYRPGSEWKTVALRQSQWVGNACNHKKSIPQEEAEFAALW